MKGRKSKANLNVGNSKRPRVGGRAEASISEEPGAVVPHAGICAGGGRVTALSTATASKEMTSKEVSSIVKMLEGKK